MSESQGFLEKPQIIEIVFPGNCQFAQRQRVLFDSFHSFSLPKETNETVLETINKFAFLKICPYFSLWKIYVCCFSSRMNKPHGTPIKYVMVNLSWYEPVYM